MFKNLLCSTILIVLFTFSSMAQSCEYTLVLEDSWGDGWNGAYLQVLVDGTTTIYTLDDINDDGSSATFPILVTEGGLIRLIYSAGTSDFEVSYTLFSSEGFVIFSDGPDPNTGFVFLGNTFCPNCPSISNFMLTEVLSIEATVEWAPSDSTGNFILEYGPAGFTTGNGVQVSTLQNLYTITGLTENTDYEVYIYQICNPVDTSAVFGPVHFKTLWSTDLGIVEIVNPSSDCNMGASEKIKMRLTNYGGFLQSLIPFNFSVNGVPANVPMPQDGLYTGVVGYGDTVTIEFDTPYDFSSAGIYEVAVWTDMDNDSDRSNDTTYTTLYHYPTISILPYSMDFEQWEGWHVGEDSQNSTWAVGVPVGPTINYAFSGNNIWATNLSGSYNNSEYSYLVSPCMDFSAETVDPNMSFQLFMNSEASYDALFVEVTTNGGMDWEKLGFIGSGVNWYNGEVFVNDIGECWNGSEAGWMLTYHSLTGFAGESECRIRFVFASDQSVNSFDGFGIDDVLIYPTYSNDIASLSVEHSSTSICGSTMDTVSLLVQNLGFDVQSGFDVAYQINMDAPVVENVDTLTLDPGEQAIYTFHTTFNSNIPATTFTISAWSDLDGEQLLSNDTVVGTSFTTTQAEQLPLNEDFESPGVPTDWTITAGSFFNTDFHSMGFTSSVLYSNLYSFNTVGQIITNLMGPLGLMDSLSFEYRIVDFGTGEGIALNGDSILIEITTDCGDSFTTLYTINENTHIPNQEMRTIKIGLDDYAGENFRLRISGYWASGDYYLDFDNINIPGCPIDFNPIELITYESSDGEGDGSIQIDPTSGTSPFSFMWDTGDTTQMINNLNADWYFVTITDGLGCSLVDSFSVDICPADLDVNLEVVDETVDDSSDGMITLTPQGGQEPYTFIWENGTTNSQLSNITGGTYIVTVTDVHACSEVLEVEVNTINGVEDTDLLQSFRVFPNPTNGILSIQFDLATPVDVKIEIISPVGRTSYSTFVKKAMSKMLEIDMNTFDNGMYYVRLITENEWSLKPVVLIK